MVVAACWFLSVSCASIWASSCWVLCFNSSRTFALDAVFFAVSCCVCTRPAASLLAVAVVAPTPVSSIVFAKQIGPMDKKQVIRTCRVRMV